MAKTNIIVVLILAAALLALSTPAAQAATKMPDFVLASVMDGKEVSSSSFENKTLLVTFFATWCPPCIEEIPSLIKLQEKFGKDGFSVIGLSVDQSKARVVRRFVVKQGINYPVLMADAKTMQSFGGVYGIPVSFLVNKNGNVVKKYPGYIPQSVLEKDLKKIL